MQKIRLGRTEMMVSRLGLGGVPLQRASDIEAVEIVKKCLDQGINFIDTAAEYSCSEERIGRAIQGRREGIILATKSNYGTRQEVENNLKQSLKQLRVDYIDLYQFHLVRDLDMYARVIDTAGPMALVEEARKSGVIKHIGLTTHSMEVAREAIRSGLFETIMFPFSFVERDAAVELLPLAREHDVGFIAMKPLGGGFIQNVSIAFKYLLQFADIVSIPGIQRLYEIDDIVRIYNEPQQMNALEQAEMRRLRAELGTRLCRRCVQCEPCPRGIPIVHIMDAVPLLKNFPPQFTFSDEIAAQFAKVTDCDKCGDCESRCPYSLPVMELLYEYSNLYAAEKKKYQENETT